VEIGDRVTVQPLRLLYHEGHEDNEDHEENLGSPFVFFASFVIFVVNETWETERLPKI
jgi:hypothetical protein